MLKLRFLPFIFLLFALAWLPGGVNAQIDEQCPHIAPLLAHQERRQRRTGNVREQLIKLCIKENKKDFEKLVARTEEIAKLTEEIRSSFDEHQALSDTDLEKLERVQGLVKKVRKDLRASKDDEEDELPESADVAVVELDKSASSLLAEIKKTTRHTVSLLAIKSSNMVMKFVKFLRFGN